MSDADWKETLRADPVTARLLETHGDVEVRPADDEFERLCVSIVNQQLSSASADAIRERLFERLGEVTPAAVLAADESTLREAGLSASKVEYLRNAATAFRDRDLTRQGLADRSDDEVVEELTAIRGLGEWSAHMYLLFALGREDVFPVGDLAVRRAMADLCDLPADDRAAMLDRAERWRPYRSYAARYLWRHYEG
jgi:DNA-3-methyladenine glycosylase II